MTNKQIKDNLYTISGLLWIITFIVALIAVWLPVKYTGVAIQIIVTLTVFAWLTGKIGETYKKAAKKEKAKDYDLNR